MRGGLAGRAFDERLQFARLVKLADNIASADEFAVDIDLRNGRPVAKSFDLIAHFGVGQDVDGLVLGAELIEHLDGCRGKAALRKVAITLHEDEDSVVRNG